MLLGLMNLRAWKLYVKLNIAVACGNRQTIKHSLNIKFGDLWTVSRSKAGAKIANKLRPSRALFSTEETQN
jgi:hypothetical protein